MVEAVAQNWLPVVQAHWNDTHARRARIQDVIYVEALRLIDPPTAALRERSLRIGSDEQQNEARVALLGDVLQIVHGRRKDGRGLMFVTDFERVEGLEMEHIDEAENQLMQRHLTPEEVMEAADKFLRRLRVTHAA